MEGRWSAGRIGSIDFYRLLRYGYGPSTMDWAGGWYGMFFEPLFMIIVLALATAVAVLLIRCLAGPWHSAQPPYHMPPGRTPLDIAR
jgi:hypothetical protein